MKATNYPHKIEIRIDSETLEILDDALVGHVADTRSAVVRELINPTCLSVMWTHNNGGDDIVLVRSGVVISRWPATPENIANMLDESRGGSPDDWDEQFLEPLHVSDYGDVVASRNWKGLHVTDWKLFAERLDFHKLIS